MFTGMTLRFRPLLMVLLVLALAMPMRLHGLIMPPAGIPAIALHVTALSEDIPCHDAAGTIAVATLHQHHHRGDHDSRTDHGHSVPRDGQKAPAASHGSLHCATAGMVMPVRLPDLAPPHRLALEALRPAEALPAEGLSPPRQERPPRLMG